MIVIPAYLPTVSVPLLSNSHRASSQAGLASFAGVTR